MKKLFFLAATVCTFFACSKDETIPTPDERIPINISVGQETRANDNTFEADDEIGVYVVNYTDDEAGTLALTGNQADNMRFTFSDNAWIPNDAIYWKDKNTPADFFVYYPYAENLSSVTAHPFSVQTDQSTAANFWASDFLWGKATKVSPTFSAIPITTNHSLSRIILNLQPGVGYPTDDWASAEKTVTITNVKTSATIDLSTGVATATGTATNVTPLKMSESGNTIRYQAMMIPQEITTAATLIKVTIDGEEYTITKSITLKPRTQHVFTLKVNEETGSLDLSIGEWETEYAELSNTITYTTTDGKALELDFSNISDDRSEAELQAFGAKIASNTYTDGQGVITFDSGVSKIGEHAFNGCSSLTSITIPDGVTQIGNKAFYGCSNLTIITIPDGVTQIGEHAFDYCSNLTSINIPDGVTQIGYGAFSSCSNLTSINIPDGVTQISGYVFGGCSSLSSITIPDGVTQIGKNAFSGCSKLTSINIPDGVTQIGEYAFSGCSKLTSITIPDGVTQIGEHAFDYCSNLTSINIPDGVTQIGEYAFFGCSKLTSINIPDGVTQIGNYAFYGCSSLTSIVLPASIERINYGAFNYCGALETIDCKAVNPPFLGVDVFDGCSALEAINVPTASVDDYKVAKNWSSYATMITGKDFE